MCQPLQYNSYWFATYSRWWLWKWMYVNQTFFPPKLTMGLDLTENTYWTMFECGSTHTYNHIAAFSIYLGQILLNASILKLKVKTTVPHTSLFQSQMRNVSTVFGLTWGHLLAGYV